MFIVGPRQTGETTLLHKIVQGARFVDLLLSETFEELQRRPSALREKILADPNRSGRIVVIDKVQQIPALLDEVQWMMVNHGIRFILCGSSARKLKRGSANLLGGRSLGYELYPLVFPEIPAFYLNRALNHGLLPRHYSGRHYPLAYWRTTSGYEVDFVLGEGEIAVDVKSTDLANERHGRRLKAFDEEYAPRRLIIVSQDREPRRMGKIEILPWKQFMETLWGNNII